MILRDAATGKEYSISLPCLIGRGKEADLVLPDLAVSHRHALVDATDDQVWIKDLGSTNGIWVNGNRITTKAFLHPGDFIQVGQMKFLLPAPVVQSAEQTVVLHVLDRARVAPELDRQRLELIYDITTELPGSRDVSRLGEKIFASCKKYFQQDHGTIALFQEDGKLKHLRCDQRESALPLSRSIVKRVLQNGESLLLEDAMSSDSFKKEESIINLRIRSAMCAPLIYHNQINGLIYIDRNIPGAYGNKDLELFQSIAAIIAPLIENARLWSELQRKYADTVDKLRNTEARLIDTERVAAYVRLAQAMAHEVRNPLVALGGLVRRIARPDQEGVGLQKMQTMVKSVERIESVLQEVDDFARISLPEKQLVRMDLLVQEVIENCQEELGKKKVRPQFVVATSNVMAPVDRQLMKKALAAVFKEILFGMAQGSELPIRLQDGEAALEISFGHVLAGSDFRDPFAPVFRDKPWCNSLFLNIAHKILLDHGGKLLLNTAGHGVLPLMMRICRSMTVESELRGEGST
ncbi:MAG: FHA domain-containing protein [Proteobacteria bacterium]|nr:FHA domain-containing protein [Pseudomonadota bacterium]MBU4296524.1 FHA domain-containing protein [Pseudomonadota bacterium]MCG2746905.1 FHA domain-containing protein [Desulfobulbaceae bacterium]